MADAPDAVTGGGSETRANAVAASEAARVAEAIRTRILDGDLAPGQRLVQQALAAELGVSRLPVRTALGILTLEGLVETRERRGTIVRLFTARDLANLVEVQEALDLLAVRLAAERATNADIVGIRDAVTRISAADRADDLVAARAVAVELRKLVIASARNSVLAQASAVIDQQVRHLMTLLPDASSLADRARSLLRGIESGDADAAESLLAAAAKAARKEHAAKLMSMLGAREDADHEDEVAEPMGSESEAYHREQLRQGVETERALAALRAQILDRSRAPGSRLSERSIAEELGVGRIPARLAIETLVGEGLAQAGGPRSAARVKPMTPDDVIAMLQVSERLAALTLRIASHRFGRTDLRRLRTLLAEVEQGVVDGDGSAVVDAMERFRVRLLEAADNDALTSVDLVVRWRLRRYYGLISDFDRALAFCRALYDALAFRDPDSAEAAIHAVYGKAAAAYRPADVHEL
ncbi:GntR family transcriptional regulator [Microbacterium sp. NPDC055903]